MSDTLECDDLGVIHSCPKCSIGNRIAFAKLGVRGRCGSCKAELPHLSLPVNILNSASLSKLTSESLIPVVIDFWAPWCGPCQTMGPEFSKAAEMVAGEVIFVKVNTEKLPDIAGRFKIEGIPAFIILKNGKEITRTAGVQMATQFVEWMRRYV